MKQNPINGTTSTVDGKPCVFYDGYWIRKYDPPTDEVAARRELIDQLTKRVFHHTEPGINTPGYNLDEARSLRIGTNQIKESKCGNVGGSLTP